MHPQCRVSGHSNMAAMEESFPRGGTRKTHKSEKTLQRSVEQDNLFDISTEEESTKRKKIQKEPAKTKKLKVETRESSKFVREKFEILNVESLCEGMRILGCVKEVNELELVISLPNGLQGCVQVTEICDAYTEKLNEQVAQEEPLQDLVGLPELFSPGMLVRCVVSSLDTTKGGKKNVILSLNPKNVNKVLSAETLKPGMLLTGTVSSLEDHGYLVDIGVSGARAFLPLQKAQEYIRQKNKGAKLKVGQYLNCLIEEVKGSGGVVTLSIGHSEVSAATATEEQSWTLNSLLPGLVVKAQVQKVTPLGLTLKFLSFFNGLVDFMHLDPKKAGTYFSNQQVRACVLCVHPRTRAVRLSLRPVFLQPGRPLTRLLCPQLGAVLDNVPVQGFFGNAGATFKLKDGALAYARRNHLSNSKKTFKPEAFKPGNTHKCRIIDYSQMDELALLSLRTSIIEAQFLWYHDIKPGALVKGKVLTIKPHGMVVKMGRQIRGLVPTMHLADILMKNPEKKYHVGDEVKCRVLLCDPKAKKLMMTLKKTLVESKLPAITCYDDAKPGLQTHGFILRVKDYGCIVKFYNDVQGLVPRHELSAEYIPDPESVFYVGQVVKVAVLNCEPSKERMLLSFRLSSDPKQECEGQSQKKKKAVSAGQLVDVKVLEKTKDGLKVAVLPHNIPGFLPTAHLSDHVTNGPLLYHWLQTGDTLHRVLCLSASEERVVSFLGCRVEGGQNPKSFSEIHPGMLLIGFVKNIKDYGVFVQFPSGLSGLAPKAILSDKFVTSTSDHFVEGQTVVAKVTNVDEEKQRMLLSLRLSDCTLGDLATTSLLLLSQCLEERQGVRSLMSNRDSVLIQTLAEMTPGMALDLEVQEVLEDGSVLFSEGPVPGLVLRASKYHRAGQELEPGQKKKAVILNVDMLKLEVHVSLCHDLVNRKAKKLKKGSDLQAIVQHLEESFAVASLVETGHLAAFSLTSHLNDTFRFDSEKLQVGQGVSLTLQTTEPGVTGLLLAVEGPAAKRTMRQTRKDSETVDEDEEVDPALVVGTVKKHTLSIGDMVTGTVKSIKPTHVVVTLEDGIIGCIHASHILDDVPVGTSPTAKLKVGKKVTARVIGGRDMKTFKYESFGQGAGFFFFSFVFIYAEGLALRRAYRNCGRRDGNWGRFQKLCICVGNLKKGSDLQAIVQHLEESFAVASLVETGHLAAFSLTSHLNDTFRFDSEKLQVGQGVSLTLQTTEPGVTGLLLAVEGPAAKRTMRQTRKDSETVDEDEEVDPALVVGTVKKHTLSIGDMVTGTVKSIKPTHVVVTLEDGIIGCIHASHILDDVPVGTSPTAKLKVGKKVTARVIGGRDMKTFKYESFGQGAGFFFFSFVFIYAEGLALRRAYRNCGRRDGNWGRFQKLCI
ncbi:PDCD11, partial [Cervus elaphus hippelaphus]